MYFWGCVLSHLFPGIAPFIHNGDPRAASNVLPTSGSVRAVIDWIQVNTRFKGACLLLCLLEQELVMVRRLFSSHLHIPALAHYTEFLISWKYCGKSVCPSFQTSASHPHGSWWSDLLNRRVGGKGHRTWFDCALFPFLYVCKWSTLSPGFLPAAFTL